MLRVENATTIYILLIFNNILTYITSYQEKDYSMAIEKKYLYIYYLLRENYTLLVKEECISYGQLLYIISLTKVTSTNFV